MDDLIFWTEKFIIINWFNRRFAKNEFKKKLLIFHYAAFNQNIIEIQLLNEINVTLYPMFIFLNTYN